MSNVVTDIKTLFRECNRHYKPCESDKDFTFDHDSRNELLKDAEEEISEMKIITASLEYASLNRMMALCFFAQGDELRGIAHLTESHAVILQQHIFHRYMKTIVRNEFQKESKESGLKPDYDKFYPNSNLSCGKLKFKLSELPKEWYTIQLTVGYKPLDFPKANGCVQDSMCSLHITVLPTGLDKIDPLCITVPKPVNKTYDGIKEIVKLLENNKSDLEGYYENNMQYWKMRDRQNNNMKTAIMELERTWLREWRILLIADLVEDTSSVKDLRGMIDKLIADNLPKIHVSSRSKWLLKKIATSACFLTKAEIARAVYHVLGDNKKLADNIIYSIYGKLINMNELRTEKRKSLILILDESIDHISFESMDVLKNHPVTRFPSFHIAYAMYKEHENTIVNGCKVVKITDDFGTFIVNPAGNLKKMEKRMKLFINYWLPNWKGKYELTANENSFENVLVNHDVLMYTGHGNGMQYLPGEKIEKLRVRAAVYLFGCSSLKLYPVGGRFPPYGISNQYLIACSPCILGMLWEVTDGDIDKMTARFMSDWIPSEAKLPWSSVNIDKWTNGVLQFKTPLGNECAPEAKNELEMLRAVAMSKESCTQYMTAAAIIVRGLPIKLE